MTLTGTSAVLQTLRARGYRINLGTLRFMLQDDPRLRPEQRGPGNCLIWDAPDVQRLESALHRRGRSPEVGRE